MTLTRLLMFNMVRTTSDKQISRTFPRIFQGQITVFKDYILYYFPQQHFAKMTGYDLQLHLR